MKFLIPILMGGVGVAGGVGANLYLAPSHEPEAAVECVAPAADAHAEMPEPTIQAEDLANREFVKMSSQFIVPVITEEKVGALMVMAIALEMEKGHTELVYEREPKLRDVFLQVMFDQATVGRFNGRFASTRNLEPLRDELRTVARQILGSHVMDVLITEIARQDV
ncbi:flagellar basal body-associated FliL family protein [Pseudoprimorskyibacter insulae]|uniref:Flagellar protein FliL n=1 Tax=Pseudoprimorskyibacter insulae TaxID=1695997 RepID=A0A2R8AZD9_9RHOB|nr:flagellar basal body-associated FliL family protein [Pseudoprimorskyibacter insulae]SPF81219.1 hypothetical protein PRI8871_03041 [Pseudoprimorskyibacter insulae]